VSAGYQIVIEHDNNKCRGGAAVNCARNQFIVDSIVNGFNLHQLDDGHWKLNFPTGKPLRKLPRQLAFGEDAKIVVGGSDHGVVYVFDKRTGTPHHILRHQERGLVQTITVCIASLTLIVSDHKATDTRRERQEHYCKRLFRQLWRDIHLRVGAKKTRSEEPQRR